MAAQVNEVQAELSKLKEEQVKERAEWETSRKQHEETLCILRSQIGVAEKHKSATEQRKKEAFDSLLKMIEKAELCETKLKGKRAVWLLCGSCN